MPGHHSWQSRTSRVRGLTRASLGLLPGLALLAWWQWNASHDQAFRFFAGSPASVAARAAELLATRATYIDILTTLAEASLGLAAGLLVGLALALALWRSLTLASVLSPYLLLLGSIPIFGLAPLLVFWLGVGILSKATVAFLSTLFITIAQSLQGVRDVQADYLRLGRALGASPRALIFKVLLPGSVSSLSAIARSAAGLALIGAFVGEFISAEQGLGHMILRASATYDASTAMVGILLLALVGYGLGRATSAAISLAVTLVSKI